jgi:hypothetical protein
MKDIHYLSVITSHCISIELNTSVEYIVVQMLEYNLHLFAKALYVSKIKPIEMDLVEYFD